MTEASTPLDAAAEDWVIDRLYHEEWVSASPRPHQLDGDTADPPVDEAGGPDAVGGALNVPAADDADAAGRGGDDDAPAADVNGGAKRTAVWLGVGIVAASAVIVAGFVFCGRGSHVAPPGAAASPSPVPAVSAAPRTSAAVTVADEAIPFAASAPGCKGGSSSAQSLSGTAGDAAWVCVRGTPEEQVDGQVLQVGFTCDAAGQASVCSYLVNSVSVTPGSVAKTSGDQDDWLAHRVVSRLQYNFYNGDALAEILTQDTGNVHGPVAATLRRPVLASRVVVIILQTSRPPAAPVPDTNPAGAEPQPGSADPAPGAGPSTAALSPSPVSDPVDATFAVAALQFHGHQPS
jgi:hypothetical protein